jgi:hypothetical protein
MAVATVRMVKARAFGVGYITFTVIIRPSLSLRARPEFRRRGEAQ